MIRFVAGAAMVLALLWGASAASARGHSFGGSRVHYGGGRHTGSHWGPLRGRLWEQPSGRDL